MNEVIPIEGVDHAVFRDMYECWCLPMQLVKVVSREN